MRATRAANGARGRRRIAPPCFLKAAELLTTTWRQTLNAATMLGQSKTAFQAEIDAACELIDFWRFNPYYAGTLYDEQPVSDHTMWNQLDYRALEGFVYAVTPFNFTSIAGNLPTAPALMGNTVIWKPAASALLSAWYIFKLLEEAGLPPGVINFVPGDAVTISNALLSHRDLAGVHFTGSTGVFNNMWKTIGANMSHVPRRTRASSARPAARISSSRIPSADRHRARRRDRARRIRVSGTEVLRGEPRVRARELCGRACATKSSRSWSDIRMGDVTDFRNFMGAVIDERAFKKIGDYLEHGRANATIVQGGTAQGRERLLHRADARRDARSRRSSCSARRSSGRSSRRTSTKIRSSKRRCASSTARRRTR